MAGISTIKILAVVALSVGVVISVVFGAYMLGAMPYLDVNDNNGVIGQDSTEPEKPSPDYIYTGQLQINLPQYVWSNGSRVAVRTGLPDIFIYRNDKTTLFGSDDGSTGSVTADINQASDAHLYMVIDYGSGTNYWFVPYATEAQSSPYLVKTLSYFDHDQDSQAEYMYELDFSSLGPLQAGEASKIKTININVAWAEATPTITGLLNATVSLSGRNDYEAKLYFSGWTAEGYALKINEFRLDTEGVSTGASNTIWDNNTATFKSVIFKTGNPTVSTAKTVTTFSSALNTATNSSILNLGLSDPTDPYKGILILYGENYGSTAIDITLKFNIQLAGIDFQVEPRFFYVDPTGTQTEIYAAGTSHPCARFVLG
jgi:hypothetical protein